MLSRNHRVRDALQTLDNSNSAVVAAIAATNAGWHASHGRWFEATEEFDRLTKSSPDEPLNWFQSPGLLLVARALFEQNRPTPGSELIATAKRKLAADVIESVNTFGFEYAQNTFPVQLTMVQANTPASRAGLQSGDVIVNANGLSLTQDN